MAAIDILTATVWEDAGFSFMARVTGQDAANVVQADITTITVDVFDRDDNNTQTQTAASLTVANVIFDTLQTDARWTLDSTGYNFRHDVPASWMATGDHRYRFEYTFTPAAGEVFKVVNQILAKSVLAS